MPTIEETIDYFREKAEGYDLVETQLYWNFSDELLWYLLKTFVLDKMKNKKIKFMDAGGGTGRWSIRILEYLPQDEGVLCDISDEMMSEARKKIVEKKLDSRLRLQECNIEEMHDQKDNTYDLVINLHNVLAFTQNPKKAFSEMFRVLKEGGFLVSVVPNKYHGLFFNAATGRLDDIESIAAKCQGRFTDSMPRINFFTPSSLRQMYNVHRINDLKILGFPVTVYPDIEETKITGTSKHVESMLGDEIKYKKLLEVEKNLVLKEEAASRGNNLFAVGVK